MIKNIENRYYIFQTVVLLIIFIFYELVGKIVMFLFPSSNGYIEGIINIIWIFLMYSTYLFYIEILMKKSSLDIKNELLISIKKEDFLFGILAILISLIPLFIISFFLPIIDSSNLIPLINGMLGGAHYTTLILFVCLMGVYGPIVEEILFRGFFWKAFERMKVNRNIILIITSFLFALYHMEIRRFPVLFTLGLTFGFLRIRTKRLGASIVAHTSINILALISTLVS